MGKPDIGSIVRVSFLVLNSESASDVKCYPVQKLCRVYFSGATWSERLWWAGGLGALGFCWPCGEQLAKDLGIGLVQLLSYSPCPDP